MENAARGPFQTSKNSNYFINKLMKWERGSPMGPTLAKAFLCHYRKEWLDNCLIHFKPMIYKRYIDNIFILFPSKEHLQLFVDYVSVQHKCLKLHLKQKMITLSRF